MESLNGMYAFVRVVQAGTFAEAARQMGVPTSTLSRRVSRLEDRLEVQLLTRTTRRMSPTEAGQLYFDRCRAIISDIQSAEDAVTVARAEVGGLLRVALPPAEDGRLFDAFISAFLKAHPKIELDLRFESRIVHLEEEGFDVAIRAGQLTDSSLMARQLFSADVQVVGSAEYLALHGTPEIPADLERHDCLVHWNHRTWVTTQGEVVPLRIRMRTNSMMALARGVRAGLGLAMLPISPALLQAEGQAPLVPVMREHFLSRANGYVIYPSRRHRSAKVRAFVDHAVAFFADHPDLR